MSDQENNNKQVVHALSAIFQQLERIANSLDKLSKDSTDSSKS